MIIEDRWKREEALIGEWFRRCGDLKEYREIPVVHSCNFKIVDLLVNIWYLLIIIIMINTH